MSNWAALGAFGLILSFFAILAGVIVAVALAANQLAYWWESRHEQRLKASEVVDRCNVYTLRPRKRALDDVRARRGDAA